VTHIGYAHKWHKLPTALWPDGFSGNPGIDKEINVNQRKSVVETLFVFVSFVPS